MRRRLHLHGNALGGALMVTMLLFLFALTLANLATFNLRAVNQAAQRQDALDAAESGLNEVAELLSRNPRLGTDPSLHSDPDVDTRLDFEKEYPNGSGYKITFDKRQEHWSFNNLVSFSSAPGGAGRTVPPGHALLVCQGWSVGRGQVVLLEALVRLEAFPYAVAGEKKVALAESTVQGYGTDRAELTGNIYSGGSLELTKSTVRGDVVHVGALTRSASTVSGRARVSNAQTLPDFTLSEFDTSQTPGHVTLSPFEAEKMRVFENRPYFITGDVRLGSRYSNGTLITNPLGVLLSPVLSILDAALQPLLGISLQEINDIVYRPEIRLNGAVLYVQGDLIGNHVNGSGAFFVEGDVKLVNSRIAAAADDRLTLFSEGNIFLLGRTYFGGVMLTHGDVLIEGTVDVRGAIFAPGNGSGGGGAITKNAWEPTSVLGGLLWFLGFRVAEPSVIERFEEQTASASYWLALGGSGSKPVFTYWNQLQ